MLVSGDQHNQSQVHPHMPVLTEMGEASGQGCLQALSMGSIGVDLTKFAYQG